MPTWLLKQWFDWFEPQLTSFNCWLILDRTLSFCVCIWAQLWTAAVRTSKPVIFNLISSGNHSWWVSYLLYFIQVDWPEAWCMIEIKWLKRKMWLCLQLHRNLLFIISKSLVYVRVLSLIWLQSRVISKLSLALSLCDFAVKSQWAWWVCGCCNVCQAARGSIC